MTIVLFTAVAIVIAIAYVDVRRLAAIKCIERAERLRMRFSSLRHRLVMHAGSGKMTETERNAFYFLYQATAFMLRHPKRYRSISDAVFLHLSAPLPDKPPTLRRQDVTDPMRPLMVEFVEASADLVQQFADPILNLLYPSLLATLTARQRRHEWVVRRRRVEAWREVGAQALG